MISFSVRRPVAITMLCLGLVVLGVISAGRIPMQLMPPMERPELMIITEFPGAGPEEVEAQITWPIERAISTVPGIENTESATTVERSEIHLSLKPGIDLLNTLSALRDRIDSAGLPEGAGKARIERGGSNQEPLLRVAFAVSESPDKSILQQAETLRQTIVRQIERTDGVALAAFTSLPMNVVEFEIHPARLQTYGLNLSQIGQLISGKSKTVSAGEVHDRGKKISVKVGAGGNAPQDLLQTVLKRDEDRVVRLADIATLSVREDRPEVLTRLNGKPTLILEVRRESGANSVEVSKRLRNLLTERNDATVLFDEGAQIEAAVDNVKSSVQQGAVLAAICVYFLVQTVWPTFVVTVIIPLSILLTWIGMHFAGLSFNLMSLAGLALGVGMLVDSSMVVLESINAESLEVNDPREAALRGTRKVFGAVAGSILATIAVFLPLAFISGPLGQVFRDVALTVSFCLIASLFTSVSVVPMLCAIQRTGSKKSAPRGPTTPPALELAPQNPVGTVREILTRYLSMIRWSARTTAWIVTDGTSHALSQWQAPRKWLVRFQSGLQPLLTKITRSLLQIEMLVRSRLPVLLKNPRRVLIAISLSTVLGAVWLSQLGSELFPEDEAAGWIYRLEFPSGQVLGITEKAVEKVETSLLNSGHFTRVASVIGSPSANQARLLLVPVEEHNYEAKVTLEATFAKIPELFYTRLSTGLLADGKPLRVEIFHDKLDQLREFSTLAESEMKQVSGVTDIENDARSTISELEIHFQKPLLDHWELESDQFISALRSELLGVSSGMTFVEGRDATVHVRTSSEGRRGLKALTGFSIPNRDRRAYLTDVARVEAVTSPALIRHIDRKRAATLSAELSGIDIETAGSAVTSKLKSQWSARSPAESKPDAFRLGGQDEARRESQKALVGAILFSIFIIFLLLASQFESLVLPLIVLLTVPLCVSGVGLALGLTGTPISAQVLVGFVILVGSSVNTSIVLVDFANQIRMTGSDPMTAIVEATVKRLRPILITTVTNILGLLPMIFATGEGAAMQKPLALTLVGGLISSTVLCLFVVPLAYSRWDTQKS